MSAVSKRRGRVGKPYADAPSSGGDGRDLPLTPSARLGLSLTLRPLPLSPAVPLAPSAVPSDEAARKAMADDLIDERIRQFELDAISRADNRLFGIKPRDAFRRGK